MSNTEKLEVDSRDSQLHKDVISKLESEGMDPYIGYIAGFVCDVVELTELREKFVTSEKLTSTSNDTVKTKWEMLSKIPELKGKIIPPNYSSYPFDLEDKEVLKTAPWVNMIHAWEKVLNLMNRVSTNQREVFKDTYEDTVNMVCSISTQLFGYTVESDINPFLGRNEAFKQRIHSEETKQRMSGTKGPNATRHVCLEEMKYILETIRDTYQK